MVRIASITKQFSAAGLLRLVGQGRVWLGNPLSAYLPDFPDGHRMLLYLPEDDITVAVVRNATGAAKGAST